MAFAGFASKTFLNLGSTQAFAWILPQSLPVSVAARRDFRRLARFARSAIGPVATRRGLFGSAFIMVRPIVDYCSIRPTRTARAHRAPQGSACQAHTAG